MIAIDDHLSLGIESVSRHPTEPLAMAVVWVYRDGVRWYGANVTVKNGTGEGFGLTEGGDVPTYTMPVEAPTGFDDLMSLAPALDLQDAEVALQTLGFLPAAR